MPALALLARLHRDRADEDARARLAGLVAGLGAGERGCLEMVAKGFCRVPGWHLPRMRDEATA